MPSLCFLPHTRMHEGVKQFVCLSVSLFVSLVESFKSEYRQISKTDSSIDIVKKVTYVYLIGSKAVLCPLLFQQFPIYW